MLHKSTCTGNLITSGSAGQALSACSCVLAGLPAWLDILLICKLLESASHHATHLLVECHDLHASGHKATCSCRSLFLRPPCSKQPESPPNTTVKAAHSRALALGLPLYFWRFSGCLATSSTAAMTSGSSKPFIKPELPMIPSSMSELGLSASAPKHTWVERHKSCITTSMQTSWGLLPKNQLPLLVGLACYTWLERFTTMAASLHVDAADANTLVGQTRHSSF